MKQVQSILSHRQSNGTWVSSAIFTEKDNDYYQEEECESVIPQSCTAIGKTESESRLRLHKILKKNKISL